MEHLVRGVRDAVSKESWYAAVALALTLPDTCGAIEDPGPGKSKRRSTAWFDANAAEHFRSAAGEQFLTGAEYYLLRCAFLHEGDFDVAPDERATSILSVLNRVQLTVSNREMVPARQMAGSETSYRLPVKKLCEWICLAVEEWLPVARQDPAKAARIDELGKITAWTFKSDDSFTFSEL